MSKLGSRRARGDDTLYARAKPEKVELTETYSIKQEISLNRTIRQEGDGTGRIEIGVPYDGRKYFTRQAVADVQQAIGPRAGHGPQRATIGHLLLADHTKTTGLLDVMRPHNQTGLVPLIVPVAAHGGGLDLTGDRHACAIAYDYQPANPPIYPVELAVQLDDLDSLLEAFGIVWDRATKGTNKEDKPAAVIERLRREVSFSTPLVLRFVVKIALPVKEGHRALAPIVKSMSLEWPALTSVESTGLEIENLPPGRTGRHKAPVRYNPVDGRLEWKDIPTYELTGDAGRRTGTRTYLSAEALLKIGHPGELFKEDTLQVKAEVEIPHYLLSGLEARLYDATGRRQAQQPKLTTKLAIEAEIYPADIFAGRTFSPYHQFVFDEIIPEEIRITDITNVLRAAKFQVYGPMAPDPQDPQFPLWLLLAVRSQGPDELGLLIAAEGTRTTQDRERVTLDNRTRIRGGKETGQLKISVLGRLPRNHRELTREMNALQQALRDRFRFHQMSRR